MYLKSIKASGFKSFADKIDLELNGGITAIVGPNGSGKSNIVDAIRWVLGEQSVKSLRGSDVMSDVIFSGSASRDPQKRASVSLIFDNHDHYLNSEFEEIEIKRTVYITGENDYFINNTKVRLKDITNLFIDSGAGQGSFNIISQGNITDIVNSKPQDRRIIFESAAGVLKYKKRKEEATRKLEKTKDNIKSVSLVIDELSLSVEPLKVQSEKAKKYLELKDDLESVEISLIASDITRLNNKNEEIKVQLSSLESELLKYQNNNAESEIEKLKLESLKLDDKISSVNSKIITISDELAKISSEKQVTLERQKYDVDKKVINDRLVHAKEEQLELQKNVNILKKELEILNNNKEKKERELGAISDNLLTLKVKKSSIQANIGETQKNLAYLQNKLDIAKDNVLNNERVPNSVKSILNNPRLKGIHNTIGNIINIPVEYETAINTSLGNNINFVVVDDYKCAQKCIEFLKTERLGRATFFPIDIIKSRRIANETLSDLEKEQGFLGIASDLVTYEPNYKNIVENQLGNVLVVDDLNHLNVISKKYGYKYRCVTIDGEIMYVGGSVSGGDKNTGINLSSKQILRKVEQEFQGVELALKSLLSEEQELQNKYLAQNEVEERLNKELFLLKEQIENKNLSLKSLDESLTQIASEITGSTNIIENKLDEQLVSILEKYNKKIEERSILENELNDLKNARTDVNNKTNDLEQSYRNNNTQYNKIQNSINGLEIEKGKNDVKLDNLLVTLSENYNLTYEAADEKYSLDMEENLARNKVKIAKKALDALGIVNLGSIEEYERISKRYEFLLSQKNDLEKASDELNGIISEMDEIMIDKFEESFKKIASEFKEVFKSIFQGGKGELKLTNPDDLLTSGISIIAEPPGKKINSTVALSGGEQALTAICLLFAILNVRPVPFIVLDEAEAALDEANVDMFGKYISEKKKDSQFVLITHKKRMMEYADTLYGITMQESGVSKIVSAKLEN